MAENEITVQAIELRTEHGHLQGKVYAGRYLEIYRAGKVTVYDVRTGSRMEAAVQHIAQAGEGR